jgi:ElaB/YqjD/DUF883 family membrane-anchored ribosome-binding protein
MNTTRFPTSEPPTANKENPASELNTDVKAEEIKQFADDKSHALREGIEEARSASVKKMDMAAAKLDDMVKSSMSQMARAAATVNQACERGTIQATTYIKAQPLKSVLLAGIAGAVLALLSSRKSRRNTA